MKGSTPAKDYGYENASIAKLMAGPGYEFARVGTPVREEYDVWWAEEQRWFGVLEWSEAERSKLVGHIIQPDWTPFRFKRAGDATAWSCGHGRDARDDHCI